MGFPLLQLGMLSPYFWLLPLSRCEFLIACCTPLVSVLFMVVSPGSRTVPAIIGAQYIHAELIKCMTLPRMFPCQLLNSRSPSPYLFLLSAKPNSPQLFCHWGLSRLLHLILISVIKFSFLLTSEQSPILESWLPHFSILPFLSTPRTRLCASPQLVFPGLFPSGVCGCFPRLLFIPHLAIRITSPASGLNMLKNLRSLLIITKSRWFVINSTQSFNIQSFFRSEICLDVSLHSSLFLSLPTQASLPSVSAVWFCFNCGFWEGPCEAIL